MRSSLLLPQTPWSSFPDLISFLIFLLQKLSFFLFFIFILFTAKAYLIFAVPSQTPYLLPAPSTSFMQFVLIIKSPLVALESQGIFNESALKWLVTCDSKYILQSKPFLNVLPELSEWACLSHTSRVTFFCQLCFIL